MSEFTPEEFEEVFTGCVADAKTMIHKAVVDGVSAGVAPFAMLVMRRLPEMPANSPFKINFSSLDEIQGKPKVCLFARSTLTPAHLPLMPLETFWKLLKGLAHLSEAYATIIGMEAWALNVGNTDGNEIQGSISKHPKRQEALVVTTERSAEYRTHQALFRHENGKVIVDPWEDLTARIRVRVNDDIFRALPVNNRN